VEVDENASVKQQEILLRFAKGQTQIDYALQGVPEQAVAWAYQGIDNIISAALLAKGVAPGTNHQRKVRLFLRHFPDVGKVVKRAAELKDYCVAWNEVRYRERVADSKLRREILDVALDIQAFCGTRLPKLCGLEADQFDLILEGLSEEAREMKQCLPELPHRWLQRQMDDLEAEAERRGQPRLAVKMGAVLNDLFFNVSADRSWVREAIEESQDLGHLLVDVCRAFYALVSKLVQSEAAKTGSSGQMSQDELQPLYDFNLVCTLSYRALQFQEWLQSDEFGEHIKEAVQRLLQSEKGNSADE
jgi:hypothetical protein